MFACLVVKPTVFELYLGSCLLFQVLEIFVFGLENGVWRKEEKRQIMVQATAKFRSHSEDLEVGHWE